MRSDQSYVPPEKPVDMVKISQEQLDAEAHEAKQKAAADKLKAAARGPFHYGC